MHGTVEKMFNMGDQLGDKPTGLVWPYWWPYWQSPSDCQQLPVKGGPTDNMTDLRGAPGHVGHSELWRVSCDFTVEESNSWFNLRPKFRYNLGLRGYWHSQVFNRFKKSSPVPVPVFWPYFDGPTTGPVLEFLRIKEPGPGTEKPVRTGNRKYRSNPVKSGNIPKYFVGMNCSLIYYLNLKPLIVKESEN